MACAVITGDASTIEHEGHARMVQRAVHEHLIEGAVEEGRVEGHHRVHPTEGEACRTRHRVLLGDADVVGTRRKRRREPIKAGRTEHGRGNCDDITPVMADPDELIGKGACP